MIYGNDIITFLAAAELTIASGAITITQGNHKLQPESSTADDLVMINGTSNGQFGILFASDFGTDTITLKHGTGNILCMGDADIALSNGCVYWYSDGTKVFVSGGGGGADIQTLLDGISTTQGTVLYRNATDWVALAPGTAEFFLRTKGAGANPAWEGVPGHIQFYAAIPPATGGAPLNVMAGASTPAEQIPYYEFVNGSITYRDFLCRWLNYPGGARPLYVQFHVMRTTAAAGETYIFEAAIRKIGASENEDLGAAHTYDYNAVTVTIPAGPPAAGSALPSSIQFLSGDDMDNIGDNDWFILRFRRNGGTATDTARVLASISMMHT